MDSWGMLLQIMLLLSACLLAGSVMAWLGQSPLAGYLLAGMVMGAPGSGALVRSEGQIESIAELGVALLLFSLGLEFSWNRILGLGRTTLFCGVVQVLLTLLLAALFCRLAGMSPAAAVTIGAMICLSSTATVLRVLVERGELDSKAGRNALAVLLVQDMAVVPLAILIPLLGAGGEPLEIATRIFGILLAAFLVIGALCFLLSYVAVRALESAVYGRNRELAVLLSVIAGLGATWAAHAAGLSPALGAFVAGMFLGNSRLAVQIRADVASLRVVLLTLFFGAVGMVADPVWMFGNLPLLLTTTVLILVGKTLIVWGLFRLSGQSPGVSLSTGLYLCQVGEFAFVLGNEARSAAVLSDPVYSALVSSSILTLLVTPWLIGVSPRAAAWLNRLRGLLPADDPSKLAGGPPCEILVIGFGPAGRGALSNIQQYRERVLVVDLSPSGIAAAESLGFQGFLADATSADVLEHLHLKHVRLVVITLPSRQDAMAILQLIRTIAPQAVKVVRSRYQIFSAEFLQAGADIVVGDEQQVGDSLAEVVLRCQMQMSRTEPD